MTKKRQEELIECALLMGAVRIEPTKKVIYSQDLKHDIVIDTFKVFMDNNVSYYAVDLDYSSSWDKLIPLVRQFAKTKQTVDLGKFLINSEYTPKMVYEMICAALLHNKPKNKIQRKIVYLDTE